MVAPRSAGHSTVVTCFHARLGFLHRHSQLQISSLPSPQAVSPQPTAVLAPGLLSNPHDPAPSPHAHQQTHVPVRGMQGHGMDCLCSSHCPVCRRPAISSSSESLRCFPSVPTNFPVSEGVFPDAGTSLLLQLPPGEQVPSCFLSSSFSLLSFILPSYAGIFIVLSGVQGLLLVFSQYFVTIVPSIDVFLMHLWREMNSMSSYSSAILKTTYF